MSLENTLLLFIIFTQFKKIIMENVEQESASNSFYCVLNTRGLQYMISRKMKILVILLYKRSRQLSVSKPDLGIQAMYVCFIIIWFFSLVLSVSHDILLHWLQIPFCFKWITCKHWFRLIILKWSNFLFLLYLINYHSSSS